MAERGIAEKFSRILDDLERVSDLSRRREKSHRELQLGDVTGAVRPETGDSVSLDYFRMVRLLSWQELFGGASARLAYSVGEKIGRQMDVETVGRLSEKIRELGLGRAEITLKVNIGSEHERIVVKLFESAASTGLPMLGQPVCHFEGGLIAGALQTVFQRKISVVETKCSAMGYDYCQFETDIRPQQGAQEEEAPGAYGIDYYEYSDENIELLSSLASHAVTAFENAVRYEHARKLVVTDPLTGAFNHAHFHARLREEVQRSERRQQPFVLVLIDIDGFREINERYSHPAGDRILREFSSVLKGVVREIDILCRYGGDEFAVILPQTYRKDAVVAIERMKTGIQGHNFEPVAGEESGLLNITASFGCSVYPDDSRHSDQLVELAENALSEAKRSGGNAMWFYGDIRMQGK